MMRSDSTIGILLALLLTAWPAQPVAAQSWKSVAKARQLHGEDFLEVKINYAVGRLELGRGPESLLYRLNSRYDEDAFTLTSTYLESERRGRLNIDIESHENINVKDFKDYDFEAGNLRVDLSNATPLALNLKFGAVEAVLELGGLRLQRLLLETGASDTRVKFSEPNPDIAEYCTFKATAASFRVAELGNSGCRTISVSGGIGDIDLDFSGAWNHDATADINVGLGGIEIRVPAELGVRIERSTFLMSFDAPGFDKEDGGVWLSRNWDTAKRHLMISISGAVGGIKIARL